MVMRVGGGNRVIAQLQCYGNAVEEVTVLQLEK